MHILYTYYVVTNISVYRGGSENHCSSGGCRNTGEEGHQLLMQSKQTKCDIAVDEGRTGDYSQQAHCVSR